MKSQRAVSLAVQSDTFCVGPDLQFMNDVGTIPRRKKGELMIRSLLAATAMTIGFSIAGGASIAKADPKVDMIPTSLKFQVGLDDDVSGATSQHIYIGLTAGGNLPIRTTGIVRVLIGSTIYNALVYGPASSGGSRGGPINPGETGILFVRAPLGTLRHCQKVLVHIDLAQNSQFGPGVFSNDQKTMTALEFGRPQICLAIVPRPLPPILR